MRLLPAESWSEVAKRRLRQLVLLVLFLLVASALLLVTAKAFFYIEYRRAVSLYNQLGTVEIGEDEPSVRPMVERYYDPWTSEHPFYRPSDPLVVVRYVAVDPWHLWRPFPGSPGVRQFLSNSIAESSKFRQKLGLRAWVMLGAVEIKNGKVEVVEASLFVEGSDGWLEGNWQYSAQIPARVIAASENGQPSPKCLSHGASLKFGNGGGTSRVSYVSASATAEQKRAIKQLRMECINSSSPCRETSDIAPSAAGCSE